MYRSWESRLKFSKTFKADGLGDDRQRVARAAGAERFFIATVETTSGYVEDEYVAYYSKWRGWWCDFLGEERTQDGKNITDFKNELRRVYFAERLGREWRSVSNDERKREKERKREEREERRRRWDDWNRGYYQRQNRQRRSNGYEAPRAKPFSPIKGADLRVLGLEFNVTYTLQDVARARKRVMLQHHPDRGGDVRIAAEANAAYDRLSEYLKRGIERTGRDGFVVRRQAV